MELQVKPLAMAVVVMAAISSVALPQAVAADSAMIEKGKKVAFDRKKGNCLTCHQIAGGSLAGNIGPPLIAVNARFPDRDKLRAFIWDKTESNPYTMMPPFGKHHILSESEIDAITDFVHSL
ncbi:MAG: sulfur oxidation c-type cytochrome SoxX [Gammaproteobacteria bacterium]|nr:sulfur oxidation c-type cytochrome SoxX [Gammaproteobacteria bacterium]